jgi:hypothetical protein
LKYLTTEDSYITNKIQVSITTAIVAAKTVTTMTLNWPSTIEAEVLIASIAMPNFEAFNTRMTITSFFRTKYHGLAIQAI